MYRVNYTVTKKATTTITAGNLDEFILRIEALGGRIISIKEV